MNEQTLKNCLQTISQDKEINFHECWKRLLLERFLSRLSRSEHTQKFIFKGGFLLAYMIELGRETSDLDFLLTKISANKNSIELVIKEIISIELKDGFFFEFSGIKLLEQPHMDYAGYRISLQANFGRMKGSIQIDVGIGDIVTPILRDLYLFQYENKPMFESEISLMVYPLETIFAEKLETVISKGSTNSRVKDYHDLLLLTRESHMINSKNLSETIKSTFHHRGTILELINFEDHELKSLKKFWTAHLKNLGERAINLGLSKDIQNVIQEINWFIESVEEPVTRATPRQN